MNWLWWSWCRASLLDVGLRALRLDRERCATGNSIRWEACDDR